MARKVKEDYFYDCDAGDDDCEDYYSTEEDSVCQSDGEYGGISDDGGSDGDDQSDMETDDDGGSDGDDQSGMETDDDDTEPKDREKGYDFETEDDVRRCQDEVTAKVTELLSVPRGFAAAFLRHSRWDAERLQDEWFADEGRVRGAVGLTAGHDVPTALSDLPTTCAICFDRYGPGETRSAGCSHFYCHECWRGYIRAAVGDGSRCLMLRCPDPGCAAPVVRELVDAVAADEDRARYAMFVVRSYVEEGTSKYVRWCPGAGCTLAVRSKPGSRLYEVPCACGHVFCFRCGEEGHRPASCDTTREWMGKNRSDGETSKWVLANTKHCPKCRRAIEKNEGCNHMTCGPPCEHEFCWICLDSWDNHSGGHYRCNRYEENPSEFAEEETQREQAKASLERYLHYYERWTAHGASGEKARRDLHGLEGGELDDFAAAVGVPPTELDFILEAYARIIEARRVLRWTYAFVYYLDPERDEAKREFCEYIQGEAEASLERLHRCAEQERNELKADLGHYQYYVGLSAGHAARKLAEFREKLSNLNLVMRNQLSNFVEAFESGMAEVQL